MTDPLTSTDEADRHHKNTAAGLPLTGSRRTFLKTAGAGAALAIAPSVATADGAGPPPRLAVEGNEVVTETGNPVTLRGVNTIDPKRANEEATERGKDAVAMIDLLTDADRGWYSDVVRVPVQPTDIGGHPGGKAPEPPAFTEAELEEYLESHLDPVLQALCERGVYAIVDFHRHWPEVQWADAEAGEVNHDLLAETTTFWETVAPRYAGDDHVVFEMYNEPTEPGMWGPPDEDWGGAPDSPRNVWDLFLDFAQPIVDTIRGHTDTLTLVGSPGWSQSPEGALVEPVEGENIAYTYHIYPGHEASQEEAWDDSAINGQGVDRVYEEYPLFVTEFGWRDYDDDLLGGQTSNFGESFVEWLESHDSIHWTAWCGDVWWEPAMFETGFDECPEIPCEWDLLGRDAGSREDMGEYVRQAIEQEGVPEGYWDNGETDSTSGLDSLRFGGYDPRWY